MTILKLFNIMKKTYLLRNLLLLLLLSGTFVYGQSWRTFKEATSALPHDSVTSICTDTAGKVWLGTNSAYYIYDTNEVMVYDHGVEGTKNYYEFGVPNGTIRDLELDGSGNVVMTCPSGIITYDGSTFSNPLNPIITGSPGSYDVAKDTEIDAAGNLWVSTASGGLRIYDGSAWTSYNITTATGIPWNIVNDMEMDASGDKWMTVYHDWLVKFDGTTWTKYPSSNWTSVSGAFIYDLHVDASGAVWLATNDGLVKFDGTTWTSYRTTTSGISSNNLSQVTTDAAGNIWIGHWADGLTKFDGAATWTNYNSSTSPMLSNMVNDLYCDGTVCYLATTDGAYKLDGSTWTAYTTATGLSWGVVYSVIKSPSGDLYFAGDRFVDKLSGTTWSHMTYYNTNFLLMEVDDIATGPDNHKWFATKQNGLAEYDGSAWTIYNTLNSGLSSDRLTELEFDSAGNLWVGTTNNGLIKFDGSTWTTYNTSTSPILNDHIESLEIDKTDNIWYGGGGPWASSGTFGFGKFDGTSWTPYTSSSSPLPADMVMDIKCDDNNDLWLATYGGGVAKFDGSSSWTIYNSSSSGLSSDYTLSIQPAGSEFYVGQMAWGLDHFDGTSWTNYTPHTSDIPGDVVLALELDSLGNLWIGTSYGAAMFGDFPVVDLGPDTTLCSGSLTLDAGNPGDSYSWNTGATTQTIVVSSPGTYWVTVTDALGQTDSDTIEVYLGAPITVDLGADTTICGSGSLTLDAGFIPGASYLWSTGATTQTISVTSSDTFSVAVLGPCGHTDIDSIIVSIVPALVVDFGPDSVFCGTTAILDAGFHPGATYLWNTLETTSSITITASGTYWVLVDVAGCTASDTIDLTIDTSCVWPGDINYDLIANNLDVLSLGVAFGSTGPVRPSGTSLWYAQPAFPWTGSFASGYNYKHADSNADGIANSADLSVIAANYGLTHLKAHGISGGPGDPDLYFDDYPDSLLAGDTLRLNVYLGRDTLIADSAYGIAFTVLYDPMLVDTSSAFVSYDTSWLGTYGTDLIALDKDFYTSGKLDIGISRTDHTNRSGHGRICQVGFVMQDDIAAKALDTAIFRFSMADVTLISYDETVIPVNLDSGQVVIYETEVGREKPRELVFNVYPNPARDMIHVESNDRIDELRLIDLSGKVVLTTSAEKMNVSDLANGLYLLQIRTKEHLETRKILIQR